jgi:acyl-CoA synthetase (AMP-forming)/AMP-acid ligase II
MELLPDMLARHAAAAPGAPALCDAAIELGYGELAARISALGRRLAGLGAGPGERVALLAANGADWVVGFLAVLDAGAAVVPLNTRLAAPELARQLAVCAPRLALVDEAHEPALARAAPEAVRWRLEAGVAGSIWHAREDGAPARRAAATPALVSFTSGTTAAPKAAVISHAALATSASVYARLLGTDAQTRTLVLVPLFHNTGFVDQVAQMLAVGGCTDVLGEFHVEDAVAWLRRRPASYLIAVPSIVRLLMLSAGADGALRGCDTLAYGGSPMPAAWIEELHARWPALRPFNIYGLTEFTSLSHALQPADALARADTVGRPVEGVRQCIADDDGAPLEAGEPGELWLAGPTRMLGYLDDPAATRAACSGPWLRTGDVGAVDPDGYLTLRGRRVELIVRGGEKIHAAQVEAELARLPAVAEAAVVGVPDDVLQERVAACVVERRGRPFDAGEAREALRDRVAEYALPERFLVVDALPRTATGKVDRAGVRALLAGAAT